jgi:hypothetical protein
MTSATFAESAVATANNESLFIDLEIQIKSRPVVQAHVARGSLLLTTGTASTPLDAAHQH